ncbi:hypothetical protein M728_002184 [Ensifer sp. WSM1721]|uniref:hypothetical protein n=1 Tax=Ensifer sp. WSM1721 TaxID=1041159 RepID=UPI0004B93B31|nr:hypothetical protein [Ensifer sp. WSM1721]
MNRTMIRYKTKPETADENQRLIEGVFRELNEKALPGVKYAALRLDGDVFVHLVEIEQSGDNSIAGLGAFAAFQSGIRERCLEGPVRSTAQIIGNFGMFCQRATHDWRRREQ